ncbi:hypothetical protein BHE74_00005643 [Ensete ventricosum]|nr:hypothetical protein BHE74_00005643 [Ensete ventricosum]
MRGMDERRLLEHERLQMEQIRELDMEELQVEEVDSNHHGDSDDDDDSAFTRFGFVPLGGLFAAIVSYVWMIDVGFDGLLLFSGSWLPLPLLGSDPLPLPRDDRVLEPGC